MKGFTKVPSKVVFSKALTSSEVRVLLVLFSLKPCHPSHANLVRWTGLNIKTIQKALISLRTKNVISWRSGKNKRNRANDYWIKPQKEWQLGLPDSGRTTRLKENIQSQAEYEAELKEYYEQSKKEYE